MPLFLKTVRPLLHHFYFPTFNCNIIWILIIQFLPQSGKPVTNRSGSVYRTSLSTILTSLFSIIFHRQSLWFILKNGFFFAEHMALLPSAGVKVPAKLHLAP